MEIKKNPKYDLEEKRKLFFQFGLIISLLFILVAFERSSKDESNYDLGELVISDEIEMDVPPTNHEKKPPPPPPPPVLKIVKDKSLLENQPQLKSTEINLSTPIDFKIDEPPVEVAAEPEIFLVVEQMPQFPGGLKVLNSFLKSNLKYPPILKENGITGVVFVRFVVTSDGKVDKVEILNQSDAGFNDEVLRVVNSMPRWEPGKQRGKAVNCWHTIPIKFSLPK